MRKPGPRKRTRASRLLRGAVFRLAAVVLGLSPFVLAEGLFAVLDWGRPTYEDDPFVGFQGVHPLFVPGADGSRYEIAKSRREFFQPDSFSSEKRPGEFRVFCLGGSTVQGRPFAAETSFPTWLELSLRAADPQRRWEAVNCGGISYASYRLVPILEEVLGHQPDLIVLYTGHNEFLEDRSYAHIKRIPGIVAAPVGWVSSTRTYTLLRKAYVGLRGSSSQEPPEGRPVLEAEVDAILEHPDGLEEYERDEKWREDTVDHFRYNLRRMIAMADDAGVPLWLVNPVCRLRDCPPFKAQHRDGITAEEERQWDGLVEQAVELRKTDVRRAVALLQEALEIDDRHAGARYLLATWYDAQGMADEARRSYLRAKELDVCPLRIIEPMSEAILEVAGETDTPLIDVRAMFAGLCDGGIPDGRFLLDHVHPSIRGHQMIAEWLTDEFVDRGLLEPVSGWKEGRSRVFRRHLDSLDNVYFDKGTQRQEMLRRWTQGRAAEFGIQPPR